MIINDINFLTYNVHPVYIFLTLHDPMKLVGYSKENVILENLLVSKNSQIFKAAFFNNSLCYKTSFVTGTK